MLAQELKLAHEAKQKQAEDTAPTLKWCRWSSSGEKKSFKVLLTTWNQSLKKSGFQDAEVELKGDRALKQRATNSYRQVSVLSKKRNKIRVLLLSWLFRG